MTPPLALSCDPLVCGLAPDVSCPACQRRLWPAMPESSATATRRRLREQYPALDRRQDDEAGYGALDLIDDLAHVDVREPFLAVLAKDIYRIAMAAVESQARGRSDVTAKTGGRT